MLRFYLASDIEAKWHRRAQVYTINTLTSQNTVAACKPPFGNGCLAMLDLSCAQEFGPDCVSTMSLIPGPGSAFWHLLV